MLITKSVGSGEAALTNLSCLSIPDETDCKTSSTSLTDLDKADWQDNKLYYLAGNLNNKTFVIITSILFQYQLSFILTLLYTGGGTECPPLRFWSLEPSKVI